jgi:SAM-dependent methyltransferase
MPLPDESVDTVLSTQMIEHVTDPWTLLAESCRLLRAGGGLILSGPSACTRSRMIFFGLPHTVYGATGFEVVDLQANGGCWSVCGLALIHALQTTRLRSRKLLCLINLAVLQTGRSQSIATEHLELPRISGGNSVDKRSDRRRQSDVVFRRIRSAAARDGVDSGLK